MDHYQCYRVWIPSTHAKHIADTIQFFPTVLCTPNLSHHDTTLQAARELTYALQNLNNANPLSQLSDDQLRALRQLSTLFPPVAPGVDHNSSPAPSPSPSPSLKPHYNLRPRPHYAAPITHANTGKSMEYRNLLADPTTCDVWLCSAANEFGRLAQGLPDNHVDATNTIFFIPITKVPHHKHPTYA